MQRENRILVSLLIPPVFLVGEAEALPSERGAVKLYAPCMVSFQATARGMQGLAIGTGSTEVDVPKGSYLHAREANGQERQAHKAFRMEQAGLAAPQ